MQAPDISPTSLPPAARAAPAAAPAPEPIRQSPPEEAPEAEPEAREPANPADLIAADDATELRPGQLRKSEFLDELEAAVCAEADAALAGTEHSVDGCPYLEYWLDYYRGQSSEHVERALRRYAPDARSARTAAEYIPVVAARVRQGVERWVRTGEISGVPDGVPLGFAGGLGGLVSGIGSLLFKRRDGGARAADDPHAVHAELGSGRPLESSVRSRMESAFGRSFARVRIHTDARARRLSTEQNARAFTVGEHVAFGTSEYRPGTLVGDALIAHELAHAAQQEGMSESDPIDPSRTATSNALERDADRAAAGAVATLIGHGGDSVGGSRLRSGLALQRCASTRQTPATPTRTSTETPTPTPEELEAARRAKNISALLGDTDCQPSPVTLEQVAAIPGASSKNFGWTHHTHRTGNFTRLFDPRTNECFIDRFSPASLTLAPFVFVETGEYRYGTETRFVDTCGKQVPLFVQVTAGAADLFKAGEIEHCQDLHRAFELSLAKFNTAALALQAAGRFPAAGRRDCHAKIAEKMKSSMGFDFQQRDQVFTCLAAKSKERDTKGWHDVNVNLAKDKRTPDCSSKTVHVLDEAKILPEVGQHPTADLVKGCGESGATP